MFHPRRLRTSRPSWVSGERPEPVQFQFEAPPSPAASGPGRVSMGSGIVCRTAVQPTGSRLARPNVRFGLSLRVVFSVRRLPLPIRVGACSQVSRGGGMRLRQALVSPLLVVAS